MTETELESNINTHSRPTDLRITDLRIVNLRALPFDVSLLRIDTNQGITGYGEVRDGASPTYALLLKSRLLGENPCNIDKIFRKIKQFGFHGRQGGGVCGIEMALFDLAGKAYGVPAYQLAGGKFRNKVLIYCDTDSVPDGTLMGQRLKQRMEAGFKFLKMDLGIGLLKGIEGAVSAPPIAAQLPKSMHPSEASRSPSSASTSSSTTSARSATSSVTKSHWRRITSAPSMSSPASASAKRSTPSAWPGTKT